MTKWKIVRNKKLYKEVSSFAGWMSYGVVASVGESQSQSLLVNAFFNTAMNAAMGVAGTINGFIQMFTQNVTKSISPQITKNFAIGNHHRCIQLVAVSSKASFFVIAIIAVPFLIGAEYIYNLWLGFVPEYAVTFIRLMILQSLICAFNAGISEVIFASGKIKLYQNLLNTNVLLSIPIAYVLLRHTNFVNNLFYVAIGVQIVNVFVRQWILHKTVGYDNMYLIRNAYLPSLAVTVLFIPFLLVKVPIHTVFVIIIAEIYLCILIALFGISKNERRYLVDKAIAIWRKR